MHYKKAKCNVEEQKSIHSITAACVQWNVMPQLAPFRSIRCTLANSFASCFSSLSFVFKKESSQGSCVTSSLLGDVNDKMRLTQKQSLVVNAQ